MTGTTHFDLAEVIARCGLVGFNGEVYDVTMPGFLKERFIIKDNFCSCGRTDCIHLFAVRVAIEQNCVTDSTQNHAQGRALGMGALATPSQLGAINVLAQSKGYSAIAKSLAMFGKYPEAHTKAQADLLIIKLKRSA